MIKLSIHIFALTLIIFFSAQFSLRFAFTEDNISLIWLPTGISLAVLLLQGQKLWLGVGLGIFIATFSTGVGVPFSMGAAIANVSEAYLATSLIHRWKVRYQLDQTIDVLKFLVIVVLIAPAIASLIGTSSFCLLFSCPQRGFLPIGGYWWLGNAVTGLVITPFILSWSNRIAIPPRKVKLSILGFTSLIIINILIFDIPQIGAINFAIYHLHYLSFLFIICATFCLKQRGATTAIFITTIIAIVAASKEAGPFANILSIHDRLLILCSFIFLIAVPILFLAAAITERDAATQRLKNLAYQDSLTELPNDVAFLERINQFLNKCSRNQENYFCAVILIDLDCFKDLNDSLGYPLGDKLLYLVAQRLKSSLSKDCFLARLGGDDFAIFISWLNSEQTVVALCENLIQEFKVPFQLKHSELLVRLSIGWTFCNCDYQEAKDIIRDANLAMYQAKTKNRKHCQFKPEMRQRVISRLKLDQALQKAIPRQEFQVVYQPIVNLYTDKIVGFETLLRWYHPKQGWISPADFIPIAERTELIKDIGEWVLFQACSQLKQWQTQWSEIPPIYLSVNVSAKQLADENFVKRVQEIIESYEIDPNYLKLEITETAVLEVNSKKIFSDLKSLGLGLYLDDFGIGESSLSRLYQLPLNAIKIDRSFVQGIPENYRKIMITQSIVNLAHNMNLSLIAEGIETKAQQGQLLNWGCQKGQGFLFSKPVPPETATNMIRSQLENQKKEFSRSCDCS